MERFRNDEAIVYFKKAVELGHVEARNYLKSINGFGQVAFHPMKLPKKLPEKRYKIDFTGSAGEYFRIWIVNTFLAIVTLGIYAAWAKVRTRRYFYANTTLDGQPFDYLADPRAILKGHLIVGAGFILFLIGRHYNTNISYVILGVFFSILPLLIYKSLRFFAHNSSYRNIRFRFTGTVGKSYTTYFLIPLLIPLTSGLLYPLWAGRRKKYFFDNLAIGTTTSSFKVNSWKIVDYYLAALVVSGAAAFFLSIFSPAFHEALFGLSTSPIFPMLEMIGTFSTSIIVYSIYEQFFYTRLTNYCWNNTSLGNIRFESTLKAWKMIMIRITNIFAMIFSIGLLIPWAKVRRTRCILDNLVVITDRDFSEFTAADASDETALGEAATEVFDIDIGL